MAPAPEGSASNTHEAWDEVALDRPGSPTRGGGAPALQSPGLKLHTAVSV